MIPPRLRQWLRRLAGRDRLGALRRRGLVVGRNFFLQDDCTIDASHCGLIRIGDDVTLGPRVMLLAHDASTKRALGVARIARLEIGDRVFIGAGAIVLPGVRIGSDVLIGAGAVVTRDIPSNSVALGNPARVCGSLDKYLDRQRERMARLPCFDARYTEAGGVTPALRAQLLAQLGDEGAFIE